MQRYLGNKGLVGFIALMNMLIPLSIDMYLPALPGMNAYFGSSSAITNLTLSAFFLFYAVGILFWGPLSDKYGRKKILLVGGIVYLLSSIACALSFNIYFLIAARIFQGIGSGGITSVSIAIIKDCFAGKKRGAILAISQSVSGLAPMLAPVVGGIILRFTNWQGTFWALAAIAAINLVLIFLFEETLKEEDKYTGTVMGSLGRLLIVGKNKSFMIPAGIFSLCALPFMGYIAVSSYIYVDYFGLSAQEYSYFFAANALVSICGPFLYVRVFMVLNKKVFAASMLGISAISGILVMTIGTLTPILFWASFALMSLSVSITRPFSTALLLDQHVSDTGAVSSLINTMFTVLGSVGMSVVTLMPGNIITVLGVLIAVFSVIPFIGWIAFMKSSIPCKGV
ncbi:Bcr/CflA family efflux MFS transporter [Parasporobacterium paucivorans]|nr:Bcr/CflA family efflux MFS transporter [Parasporobacterium paucivorans]